MAGDRRLSSRRLSMLRKLAAGTSVAVVAARHQAIRILTTIVNVSQLRFLYRRDIRAGGPLCNKAVAHGQQGRTEKHADKAERQRTAENAKKN